MTKKKINLLRIYYNIYYKLSNLVGNKHILYGLIFLSMISLILLAICFSLSPSYLFFGMYSLMGLLVYTFFILNRKKKQNAKLYMSFTFQYILMNFFLLAFLSSIIYLRFFEELYNKSLYYYFSIGICLTSLIFLSVADEKCYFKFFFPFLILLLSLNIFLSNHIVFPYGVYASGDTHYQIYEFVLPILKNGKIPSAVTYTKYPGHQLLISSLSLITKLDSVLLYRYICGLLYAIATIFIYSFGKRFFNLQFGIVASLLYMTSPPILFQSTHPYQFSYALVYGAFVLFILYHMMPSSPHISDGRRAFRAHQKIISWLLIFIVSIVCLLITHFYTTIFLFFYILIIFIHSFLFKKIFYMALNKRRISTLLISLIIFSLTVLIILYYWRHILGVWDTIKAIAIFRSNFGNFHPYQMGATTSNTTVVLSSFINYLGLGLTILFAIVGGLYGLRVKINFVWIWGWHTVFLFGLIFIASTLGLYILMPDRLYAVVCLFSLIFLAATGIMAIFKKVGKIGKLSVIAILFLLFVANMGSSIAGEETAIYRGERPYAKLYDTIYDLEACSWINDTLSCDARVMNSQFWVWRYYDTNRNYLNLPISISGKINITKMDSRDFLVLTMHDLFNGVRIQGISELEFVTLLKNGKVNSYNRSSIFFSRMIKLEPSELYRVSEQLDCIYTNNEIIIFHKH